MTEGTRYLFFAGATLAQGAPAPDGLAWSVWRPALTRLWPRGIDGGRARWATRALMHYARVYCTREYMLVLAYDGDRLVHRTGVYPRWFRFPAMAPADVEIGTTWTDPAYRGRGIAAAAILRVRLLVHGPGRRCWYITRAENPGSIRAAEKGGLACVGRGVRRGRLGLRALGAFVIEGPAPARLVADGSRA